MTTKHSHRGRTETLARRPLDAQNGAQRPLPHSAYPTAGDVAWHGVQPLPASLPLVNLLRAQPHRASRERSATGSG